MVKKNSCRTKKNLKGGDNCGSHVMTGGDSTPYIKLDLSEQNSVLAGSYAPVSQDFINAVVLRNNNASLESKNNRRNSKRNNRKSNKKLKKKNTKEAAEEKTAEETKKRTK